MLVLWFTSGSHIPPNASSERGVCLLVPLAEGGQRSGLLLVETERIKRLALYCFDCTEVIILQSKVPHQEN